MTNNVGTRVLGIATSTFAKKLIKSWRNVGKLRPTSTYQLDARVDFSKKETTPIQQSDPLRSQNPANLPKYIVGGGLAAFPLLRIYSIDESQL